MDLVFCLLGGALAVSLWAHGYSVGALRGFRRGCGLWRPEYYRVFDRYIGLNRDYGNLILQYVPLSDEERADIEAAVSLAEDQLTETKETC